MKIVLMVFLTIFFGGNVCLGQNKFYSVSDLNNGTYGLKVSLREAQDEVGRLFYDKGNIDLVNEEKTFRDPWFKMFYIFNTIALLLVGLGGIFYIKHVKKLKRTLQLLMDSSIEYEEKEEETLDEKRYITEEKEKEILIKIGDFEKELGFLEKDISLNVLAGNIGVNHRYLSYVVNKNKECDFATYVNELRIGYIVCCLKEDPKFLKYKISYLAEQCGFASHSRFTVTFKKVTGDSPSVFISKLKNRKSKVLSS